MINLHDFSLNDILPQSLKSSKEDRDLAESLSAILQTIFKYVDLINPEQDTQDFLLDLIAWEEHVDFYSADLPNATKRELITKASYFHEKKGTPAAVEELIITVFGEGKVVEWYEYGGEPFHFKVQTNNTSVTTEQAAEFIRAIESVKRKSTVLDKIELTTSEDVKLYFTGFIHSGDQIIIKQGDV